MAPRSSTTTEPPLDRFRPYLALLAQTQLDRKFRQRIDASDVVQQTLLEAHEKRAQYRGHSDAELAGWLRQMLVHNIADVVRALVRPKRDIRREQSLEREIDDSLSRAHSWLAIDQSSPSQHAAKCETMLRMADALGDLPEDQRSAIVMHHLNGLKLREIAEHFGRSESAVAGLLHRGLKRMRDIMSKTT